LSKLNKLTLNDKDIRVLIVEDEIILAMAMEMSLQEMGYIVSGIETTATNAINHAKNNRPDIVIMDINLNDSSGIDAANEIWKSFNIPIVFLTSYTNDNTINQAMSCEPYGYLIKPCKDKELKATIKMALHKHKYFFSNKENKPKKSKYIIIDDNLTFDIAKTELLRNGEKVKLTKNEKKLFEVMSQKAGEIVSFEQISIYIWREELYDMGKLRTLIYRLRQKLNTNPFENLYESGYKLKVKKDIA